MLFILCDGEFFDHTVHILGPLWGETLSLVLFLLLSSHFEDSNVVSGMEWTKSDDFWDLGPVRVYLIDLDPFAGGQGQ